ncbi:peptide ABC transporter substrate-binding protein [Azorhizobium oxalatiphilum]|uniref:Peptide ABC transporter substrate-binding protein n=1 Tax=Azorhizobium oxalatiphilum TaxID=980631 RepID=A0A917BWK8_9HYPH|nr:ABC transporter substrate-binding protein [Azorhizobium oxalatiphilum]GGF58494.1 peptide ABC transporter substrate-binding protein [Azorhizobium oxalatiphilum]
MTNRRDFLKAAAAVTALPAAALYSRDWALAAEGRKGGHLAVSLVPEPAGLIGGLYHANPSIVVSQNLFDGLVTYDADLNPVPQLATSWTKSQDGKVVTLKLREGVKWHDGQPFTSADVKFSIETIKATSPVAGPTYATLTDIGTPDAHTVVLTFSHPSQALWSVLDGAKTQILPRHLYEGAPAITNPLNVKPVGNGPFIFKEWVRGSHIKLTRNPDYWDKSRPFVDELTFRIIPDAGARAAAFETGEVQYAPLPAIPLLDAEKVAARPGGYAIQTSGWEANAPMYSFEFNLDRPTFKDIRVRQAFAHAIDRELLARNGFYGFATPATGPVPSYQKRFYTGETEQYPFDPKKAEALLDAAGLKRGADGIRLRIDNLPIPYSQDFVRAAQLIQQSLKRVGIQVEIRNFDVATFFGKLYKERDFDTTSTFAAAFADPQIGVFRRYWSKAKVTTSGGNISGYQSAEADRLIEASLIEGDPDKRRALIQQLQILAQRDLPSVNLLELKFFRVVSNQIEGVNQTPFGAFTSVADVAFKA